MTLQKGVKIWHNGEKIPVELLEFVEEWQGSKVWIVKDVPDGLEHIMRFKPKDIITPYKEAA